jgi:hypothetical protein
VYLRHLRAKVFFYSLIRFVLQDKIFAELRDFLLQWYGIHGWGQGRLAEASKGRTAGEPSLPPNSLAV